MKNDFLLYIDLLGFADLCDTCDPKLEQIYECLLATKRNLQHTYRTVIFSDTILVHNVGVDNPSYALMFLCEFFTVLQYRLSKLGVFLRGVITNGRFLMERREEVEVFYGPAIVAACRAEKDIKAVGLFMSKGCADFCDTFATTSFSSTHVFVQTLLSVVKHAQLTSLSVEVSSFILKETDELCYLRDDVELLKQIFDHCKEPVPESIRHKHKRTWELISHCNEALLEELAKGDFDLNIVNDDYDWSNSGMF